MNVFWIGLIAASTLFLLALIVLLRKKPLQPIEAAAKEQLPQSFKVESNFTEVDGTKVHYLQTGAGPDLVLLHGIGASVYVWRFLLPLLQTDYRVTAIDLPGFGKSAKDIKRDYGLDAQCEFVAKTLNSIGITNATLIGSSMGGAIALWLNKKYPDRFQKIVAIGPAADHRLVPVIKDAIVTMIPLFQPLFGPFVWRTLNRHSMRIILTRVFYRRELITKESIEAYLEPYREGEISLKPFWASLELLADKRLPDELKDIKGDVLILYGRRDRMVSISSIDKVFRLLPNAKLEIHPHGGHHVMEDEPAWTVENVRLFISSKKTNATEV